MKNPFRKMMFLLAFVAAIFSMLSLLEHQESTLIQPTEEQVQKFFKKPIHKESEEVFSPFSSSYKENRIKAADSIIQEDDIIYYIQENTILRLDEKTLQFQEKTFPSFYPVEMQMWQNQLIVFGVTSSLNYIQIDENKAFPYENYEFQILILEKKNLTRIRQIQFFNSYYIQSQQVNGKLYLFLGMTEIINQETKTLIYPKWKDSYQTLASKLSHDKIFMLEDGQPVRSMLLLCELNLNFLFRPIEMMGLLGVDGMIKISSSYLVVSSSSYQKAMQTHFLFFSLHNFNYLGKVTLKGYVMNEESMDLNEEYFRVLLSYYEEEGIYHHVYNVSVSNYKLLSMREVAPLENIYCLRYQKDRLYISAFQYIDPLYVFDFSDPLKIQCILKKETPWVQEYLEVHDDFILTIGRKINEEAIPQETVISVLHPTTLDVLQFHQLDHRVNLQIIWDERALAKNEEMWLFLGYMEQKAIVLKVKIQPSIESQILLSLQENWIHRIIFGQEYLYVFGIEGLYLYHLNNFSLAKTFTYQRKEINA